MKKLFALLMILGFLFIETQQVQASFVGGIKDQINNFKKDILSIKIFQKASVSDYGITIDNTPRIMYWSGKVNQHVDSKGAWQTDNDGSSGAGIDKLIYCKKFWPNTTSVIDYKMETVNSWHDAGNINNYISTRMSSKCVESPTVILVNGGWSEWFPNPTEAACGTGTFEQTRTCTNPSPSNGGVNCSGSSSQLVARIACFQSPSVCLNGATNYPICTTPVLLPINGGWSSWTNSGSCVNGLQTQTRTCTNPTPVNGGANCIGLSTQQISCSMPVSDSDCNKKNYTAALIFVTKSISQSEMDVYKEKLDYFKNRFPWAFNFATGGLATMSIPENPVTLDSTGLIMSDGGLDIQGTIKKFYETSGDNFDFVYIFSNINDPSLSFSHRIVKNNIKGIGINTVDTSLDYGSKGRLMGVTYLKDFMDNDNPDNFQNCYKEQKNNFSSLTFNSNCGMNVMLHETAHQWGVYVGDIVPNNNPSVVDFGIQKPGGTHYYFGLSSPNGTNDPLGDTQPWDKAPDNSVYLNYANRENPIKYHPFTLYFMGLLPENKYDDKYNILQNYGFSDKYHLESMESVYKQVSVRDIINKEGPRTCQDIVITTPIPIINRTLKVGIKGNDVKALQSFLGITADGSFGQKTQSKVMEWQAQNGLKADGLFGIQSAHKAGLTD